MGCRCVRPRSRRVRCCWCNFQSTLHDSLDDPKESERRDVSCGRSTCTFHIARAEADFTLDDEYEKSISFPSGKDLPSTSLGKDAEGLDGSVCPPSQRLLKFARVLLSFLESWSVRH
jgi:hypothetical protein